MANRALPFEIRDSDGRLKYRKGAMVSEADYEALTAGTATAPDAPQRPPFVAGVRKGPAPKKIVADIAKNEPAKSEPAKSEVKPALPKSDAAKSDAVITPAKSEEN